MTARRLLSPYGSLTGFVLLLAALFGVAYAVGSAAGPAAPGIHRTGGGSGGGSGSGGGGMGGMDGMHDMGAPVGPVVVR
ncbi:hypothetical protein AB0H73_15740 [Streptomyces olivoreticuli]|uniref:hypothetical protein n=1 Tax=Streptomyces olivoreticuli TaxID=68246 RepID=UPI000E27E488|nr:hypothetical protein [Streptomyces olivoreticuli]